MTSIKEANVILQKETITIDDYNRFIELGDIIKGTDSEFEYDWLCEGFELRLPELAKITGNYNFAKKTDL